MSKFFDDISTPADALVSAVEGLKASIDALGARIDAGVPTTVEIDQLKAKFADAASVVAQVKDALDAILAEPEPTPTPEPEPAPIPIPEPVA
jgi:outer membrane protein TolC